MRLNWRRKQLFLHALLLVACCGCMPPPLSPSVAEIQQAKGLVEAGTIYLRQGSPDRARAAFEVALDLAGLPEALDGLGCVAFLSGDLNLSEHLFWQAYNANPSYEHVFGNLALLYEARADWERAEYFHKLAVARNPARAQFRNNLAVFAAERKASLNRQGARAELHRAGVLSPANLIEKNLEQVK